MLTPTTPVITDPITLQKQYEEYEKRMSAAQAIFEVLPLDPRATEEHRVRYPDMLGTNSWTSCYYGRQRWYEYFRYENDPYKRHQLLAITPAKQRLWDEWQDPDNFLDLLNSEYTPANLARKFGSNMAALQLLADMWDHFQVRDKFTIQLPSPSRTACLYSATSLLR